MKTDYIEMNIDEMKQVKETWQIHLKIFIRRLRHVQNIEETKENRWELLQLAESLKLSIETIKKVMAIYSELINLGENCELDEDYFLSEMKEVQILHKSFKDENNKKSTKDLLKKYPYNYHSTKPTLNI